jgi:predicted alpha/beta superfamily hydrolase
MVGKPRTERYDFASKVNGQAYRVCVSLPQAYVHEPTARYPVILVSPSLWWDEGITAKYEEAYAAKHKALPVRLFMSDGELETANMLASMRQLASALTRRNYQGLQLHTRIFEGESHLSTFPVALTRGLTTVFARSGEASSR